MKTKKNKIRGPLDFIRDYIKLDWLYYFTPFVLCLLYSILALNFKSLQHVVNSIYANVFNFFGAIGLFISTPNVVQLIYCQRRVLRDMPEDIILPAASSERYGGAGAGKTSSAVLQAIFEAHAMESKLTTLYYYIKSNYDRWKQENPRLVKDFAQLERSIKFWRQHPEYIPFLGSNITIYDNNGRKSMTIDGDHLAQKEWLPSMFILVDEAGNELPQELFKERPADITMFFRYIRHFGFRVSLLEQKQDGLYINVRAVLGSMCLAIGQSNKLIPTTLLQIIEWLESRLPRYDVTEHPEVAGKKRDKMDQRFKRLGVIIEKLKNFAGKLGFRIWHELIINCPSAQDVVPPQEIDIYCTNAMPLYYDDREYSQLYLPNEGKNPIEGDFPSISNESGKKILKNHYSQEADRALLEQGKRNATLKAQKDELKLQNDIIAEQKRAEKLAKKTTVKKKKS